MAKKNGWTAQQVIDALEADINTLNQEFRSTVKKMVNYRQLYEGQKSSNGRLELWLEGYRRLIKEKGCQDTTRLLEILDEIEKESSILQP